MSKIRNSGLDQYGAEPFEQQQFGTAGIEAVKVAAVCESLRVQWMNRELAVKCRLLIYHYYWAKWPRLFLLFDSEQKARSTSALEHDAQYVL